MKTYQYKQRRTEQRLDRGEEEQKGRSPEIPCSQNCLCRHLAVNSREVGSEGSPPPRTWKTFSPPMSSGPWLGFVFLTTPNKDFKSVKPKVRVKAKNSKPSRNLLK